MLRTHASAALMAVAAMTALTGCYSFYPQGGHPGMHSPSTGPAFPTQAVPQSSFVMPDDAAGSPSAVTQTFAPSGRLEAPTPQAAPGASTESPVPEPRDPGSDTAEGDLDADRTTQKVLPSNPDGVSLAEPGRLDFQPPRVIASADPDQKIPGVVGVSLEETLDDNVSAGMARDSKYRWLQGLVEYDAQYRTWHMTYTLSPNVSDTLGGEVTLTGKIPFQPSDHGKLFRVSGNFIKQVDRLGKPLYDTRLVERLVPAKQ